MSCGTESGMSHEEGPKLLKFPAANPADARAALQAALDEPEPLTNVLILSVRPDGSIYNMFDDRMTLGEANWLIDSYWFELHRKAASK